jgi:hypothetical protein
MPCLPRIILPSGVRPGKGQPCRPGSAHTRPPPSPRQVRKSIIGFDVPGLDTSSAWEAGFGSLYWMEGVATRLRDKHGGGLYRCAAPLTPPPTPPV